MPMQESSVAGFGGEELPLLLNNRRLQHSYVDYMVEFASVLQIKLLAYSLWVSKSVETI